MPAGPSATDRAYQFAKKRILDGRFPGGELITEGDISEGVGISRTPVREAFLRLESEGLLRLYPKRGALVTPISVGQVESVMETRLVIERHALTKVIALGVTPLAELEKELARQTRFAENSRPREFVEADREFHRLYVAAAANPILLGLYDSLRDQQSRMGLSAIARDERRTAQIIEEHTRILAALARPSAEEAVAVIDDHLSETLRLLLFHPTGAPGHAA